MKEEKFMNNKERLEEIGGNINYELKDSRVIGHGGPKKKNSLRGRFAVFASEQEGKEALRTMLRGPGYGSLTILQAMNRRYTREKYLQEVEMLKSALPEAEITTDIIVGFPGETEEDFNKLLAFIKETKFEKLGVFEYSREENTPAYDMPDQIPEKLKRKRYDILMREQRKIHKENNQKAVGKTLKVLCEGYDKAAETYFGRSYADAPDIDGKVYFSAPRRLRDGEMVDVNITEVLDYDLYGRAL